MDRVKALVTGTVMAAVLTSGAAFAQDGRGGGRGPDGGGRTGGPALALRGANLTDAQEQQIRDIRKQEREALRPLQDKLRAAADAQRAAVAELPVNEGLIRQTTAALADLQAEVAIRQAHLHSQVWGVLTPEQQARVTKLRAERDARRGDRVQKRQERRRG